MYVVSLVGELEDSKFAQSTYTDFKEVRSAFGAPHLGGHGWAVGWGHVRSCGNLRGLGN